MFINLANMTRDDVYSIAQNNCLFLKTFDKITPENRQAAKNAKGKTIRPLSPALLRGKNGLITPHN